MKKLLVFLGLCVGCGAYAAPSRMQYLACDISAEKYASIAVFYSNMITQVINTTKPKSKQRDKALEGVKEYEMESRARDFESQKQEIRGMVRSGQMTFEDSELFRLYMEIGRILAFNEGTSNFGRSQIFYKNAIEEKCLKGS